MRLLRIVLTLLILVAPAAGVLAQSRPGARYRVIVNPENPIGDVDRKFLSDVFLKRTTRWNHLELIRPVDLRPDSAVRRGFSEEILRRSVGAVRNYWQQLVFSGRDVPPPELNTDEDVITYVLKFPAAIGYVSPTADLRGAKALNVR